MGRSIAFHKNQADAGSEGLSSSETSGRVLEMTITRFFATSDWNTSLSA
jgi:hypothetical protein